MANLTDTRTLVPLKQIQTILLLVEGITQDELAELIENDVISAETVNGQQCVVAEDVALYIYSLRRVIVQQVIEDMVQASEEAS